MITCAVCQAQGTMYECSQCKEFVIGALTQVESALIVRILGVISLQSDRSANQMVGLSKIKAKESRKVSSQ